MRKLKGFDLYMAVLERSLAFSKVREQEHNLDIYRTELNKFADDLRDLLGAKI